MNPDELKRLRELFAVNLNVDAYDITENQVKLLMEMSKIENKGIITEAQKGLGKTNLSFIPNTYNRLSTVEWKTINKYT